MKSGLQNLGQRENHRSSNVVYFKISTIQSSPSIFNSRCAILFFNSTEAGSLQKQQTKIKKDKTVNLSLSLRAALILSCWRAGRGRARSNGTYQLNRAFWSYLSCGLPCSYSLRTNQPLYRMRSRCNLCSITRTHALVDWDNHIGPSFHLGFCSILAIFCCCFWYVVFSFWVLMNDGAFHFLINVFLDFLLLLMGIFVCVCFFLGFDLWRNFLFLDLCTLNFRLLLLGPNLFLSNINSQVKKRKIFIFFPLFLSHFPVICIGTKWCTMSDSCFVFHLGKISFEGYNIVAGCYNLKRFC
jgi:hypothetical protein